MKPYLVLLVAILPAACTSGPGEKSEAPGYHGIEEVRILTKGME